MVYLITFNKLYELISPVNPDVLLCPQELRKVENIFIINLAIADLCVTAYVDPLSIIGK